MKPLALAALVLFATSTSAIETTEPGGNYVGIASDDGSSTNNNNNNNYREADAPGDVLLGLAAGADNGDIRDNEEVKISNVDFVVEELVETSTRLKNLGANLRGSTPGLTLGEDPKELLGKTSELIDEIKYAAENQADALEAFEDHYKKDPLGSFVSLTKAASPLTDKFVSIEGHEFESDWSPESMDNVGDTLPTNPDAIAIAPTLMRDAVEGAQSFVRLLEDVQEVLSIPAEIESGRKLKDVVKGSKLFGSIFELNGADVDGDEEDASSAPTGSPIHFGTYDSFEHVHDGFESLNTASSPHVNTRGLFKDLRRKQMRKVSRAIHGHRGYTGRKRRHLRRVESNGFCPEKCSHDDDACRCRKLAKCAGDLTSYDLAVMFGQDRISDSDYDEDKFGVFDSEEIQLFSAGDGLPRKALAIKNKAEELLQSEDYSDTSGKCSDLLSEFYTLDSAIDKSESRQLTVDQVCDSVDTFTKLRMSQIVRHYDRAEEIAGPFVENKQKAIIGEYEKMDIPSIADYSARGSEQTNVVFRLQKGPQELYLKVLQSGWDGYECGSQGGPVKFEPWNKNEVDRFKWKVFRDATYYNKIQIRSVHCDIYSRAKRWKEEWFHFDLATNSNWNGEQELKLFTVKSMQSNTRRYHFKAESKNGMRLRLYHDNSKTVIISHANMPKLVTKNSNNPGDILFPNLAHRYYLASCASASSKTVTGLEGKCNAHYLSNWNDRKQYFHEAAHPICEPIWTFCRNSLTAYLDELRLNWEDSVGYSPGSYDHPNTDVPSIAPTAADTSFKISADKIGDFGMGDFSIEMEFKGMDRPLSDDGLDDGALFIRAQAPHPYTGPTVFIKEDGEIYFRVSPSMELRTPAGTLESPRSSAKWRHLKFSRRGNVLTVSVDGNEVTKTTSFYDRLPSETGTYPLVIRGNHVNHSYQSLFVDVRNIKLSPAPGAVNSNSVQCNSVSYKTCSDFAVAFDAIYQHRDMNIYPDGNPMLRDPDAELNATMSANHILSQIKFPLKANLRQDISSGIKTFSNYTILHDFDDFPGDVEVKEGPWTWGNFNYDYSVDLGCTASHNKGNTSAVAMQACDRSISVLAGKSSSVGALSAIAKGLRNSNGTEGMPGQCCLDNALNSERFGEEFSPFINHNGELVPMVCNNPGHFHLGISREACETVNGKWFRSPCLLLKRCIDRRPKLGDPGFIQSFENKVRGTPRKEFLSKLRISAVEKEFGLNDWPVIQISELEVRDSDGFKIPAKNWAQDSTEDDFTANKAVNGDFTDYAKTDIANPGAFILIDFGDAISFSELKIYMPQDARLPNSTIELLDESEEENEDDVVVGSLLTGAGGTSKEPDIDDVDGVDYALYTFYAGDFEFTRNFYNGGYVIEDPNDEDQCETARTELGFAADHPHDTEVCDEFLDQMCDEEPPLAEDIRRLFGEQSSTSHAPPNSARRNLQKLETTECASVLDVHNLRKKPCGEMAKTYGGAQFGTGSNKPGIGLKIAYKIMINVLTLQKDIFDQVSTFTGDTIEEKCKLLPDFPGILKRICLVAREMYRLTAHTHSLVWIITMHTMTTLQDEFNWLMEGKGPADQLLDKVEARDEMMYENFKVVMDVLITKTRRLETTNGVGPNLEMDKFEAVSDEMTKSKVQMAEIKDQQTEIKAEIKAQQTESKVKQAESNQKLNEITAQQAEIKDQQTEIKAKQAESNQRLNEITAQQAKIDDQQAEIKAEIKSQQTEIKAKQAESNQKLNALEAMMAQLIEQNKQLLDSMGAGQKEE